MERREIEIFLTLAEELHFGRTAERLLISQARVSHAVKALERRFGVTLFDRTSRRVALTAVGAALYADVRAGHDRIERGIAAAVAAGRGIAGTLSVGLEAPAVAELAAPVFGRFRAQNPGIELVFRETGFTDPLDLLRSGEVDVAVTNAPVEEHDLHQGPAVYTEPVVLAVSREHRLAGRAEITLDDLDHETVFRAGRRAAPYRREPEPVAATLLDLLARVAAGEGVCPLAAHAADYFARPTLAMVPFTAGAPPVRWVLCRRRGRSTARVAALAAAAAAAG
ncbi:DNA-binding transcriptional regulator, LysR family [Pseudonocardia ammonioxydans]|uniref:DNA-binding transcriptional regulator, LysR family n=1 Tax=Pseudonocardia ammonioxydans TaxID=260086 RepID=A0A1I4S758_PSUAM|nr:LysR family transcriptional regulator [Pseudonocardia ammonioxydans]SFM60348.1 DNA-binding transcriptional regulator, LysR family [Pseudonocardia ammonioxydans]